MSASPLSDSTDAWSLAEYIEALIDTMGAANPAALARMRQVVGDRRARIILDDEAVEVSFDPEGSLVHPSSADSRVHGTGETDSGTVLAMLDGYLEVTDAIIGGQLHVSGEPEDIMRMFVAIEILLDASSRTPGLQGLADRFRRERRSYRATMPSGKLFSWYPFRSGANEMDLLARLDLLPDDSGGEA